MGKQNEAVHSLASTQTGDVVEVRKILFETLRSHCSDLDIREGDVIRCRAGTASQLMLVTPGGRTVALQRDLARFIQVCDSVPLSAA